jgi:methyl-accepting chemotaxis protein
VRLGIRQKLFASFGAVLCLLSVVGFIGYKNTSDFAADFQSLYNDRLVCIIQWDNAVQALYELRLEAATYPAATDTARAQTKTDQVRWQKQIDENVAAYAATYLVPEEQTLFDQWKQQYPVYLQARAETLQIADQGDANAAQTNLIQNAGPKFAAAHETAQKLINLQDTVSQQMYTEVSNTADLSKKLLLGAIAAALLAGLCLAFFISRSVANGVKAVQKVLTSLTEHCATSLQNGLTAMAASDLTLEAASTTTPIQHFGSDEVGQTAAVTNTLLGKIQSTIASYEAARTGLADLVGQVQRAADGVADTSLQLGNAADQTGSAVQQVNQAIQNVAVGAQDTSRNSQETNAAVGQLGSAIDGIARGASEQARQVQSTSATASRMAADVEQVASNANQVAAVGEQTRAAATHGGDAVRETTAAMTAIRTVVSEASSKVEELGRLGEKIGAVVETIDDIAEQTNLLALNAAIEAARAGEHGKGFAVVAEEVRKLAERSGRETKQIAELIQQVQAGTKDAVAAMEQGSATVDQGADKAAQAGRALEEIMRAIELTVRQVGEIAASSQAMAAGARSVTEAMESISAVVEENTAATEEMAAQSGQVSASIQSIAAVAEEQSASTEEVSASAEEMSAQVEEMSAQAQALATTADELRELVARFKVQAAAPATKVVPLRRAA